MIKKWYLLSVFSLFSLVTQAQLRSFNSFLSKNNDVTLEWLVEAYNECEVIVEHSTDSFNFNEIYAYPGTCTGGSYGESYSYKHSSPVMGINYYRLNLGRYGYTQTMRIEVTGAPNGLKLAPNPFNERTKVTVENNGLVYDVIILDLKGNIISTQENMNLSEFWLERNLLHEGIYYLILTDYRQLFTYSKIVVRDDY